MIFWEKLTVDLEKEKCRIAAADYSPSERGKLLFLVSQIERGLLTAAWENLKEWDHEEREYVGEEVWLLLEKIGWGVTLKAEEK